MSEQALVAVKDEDSEAEAVSPVVKGRQRKEWKLIATDELQQGEDLELEMAEGKGHSSQDPH